MTRVSQGTRTNKQHRPNALPCTFSPGFLGTLDKRCKLTMALTANYDSIVEELGGPDQVGYVKRALIERFVWLEGILQSIEHDMAAGSIERAEVMGKWIAGLNAFNGLAKTLGIEPIDTGKPWIVGTTTNGSDK